jgi:adhesin transport system membrane fusion protein
MSSRSLATSSGKPLAMPRVQRGDRQAKFLAQSILLEEAGSPRLIRLALLTICAAVAAFIGWAAVTNVDEVAVAAGEVVPTGQIQVLQHLEGGIISAILVRDGDIVDPGQVLLRLNPATSTAELREARALLTGLLLRAERLGAVAEGRAPDFAFAVAEYPQLVADQMSIFKGQIQAADNRRSVLKRQIEQKSSELALFNEQEDMLRKQVSLLEEELSMREQLYQKGLASKIVYLDVQRDVNRARGDMTKLVGERRTTAAALSESRSRLDQLDSDLKEAALNERGQVTSEIAQVRESIRKSEEKVRRLEIRAPLRGIVKGLKNHTIGGVIVPGNVVLEVVPLDQELVVEARISTRDIGHVQVGHPATLKVVTYDFARYGGITGEVRDISASSFLDEKGQPYFKGTVAMDRNYVGFDPERNRVLPGMTVQADISTGKKTLLQYLLKPVYASVSQAFRER